MFFKRLIFLFVLIIPVFHVFSQELFYLNSEGNFLRFREPDIVQMSGELLIAADTLREFGAGVTTFPNSDKYYIVNQNTSETLIADPIKGMVKNFLTKIDGPVMSVSNRTYLSAKVVFHFLEMSFDGEERYYVYREKNILKLLKAEMIQRSVQLDFSSPFFDETSLIKIDTKGNDVEIKVFPASIEDSYVKDLILENSDEFYSTFNISFNVPVDYKMVKNGSSVTIYFNHVDPYLVDTKILAEGILWYSKKEKVGKSNLNVSYLEVDLSKAEVDITPVIASGNMGAKEKLSSMTRRNYAYGGVNGSYYDTVTSLPVGTLIIDKKLLSEPYYYPRPFLIRTAEEKYSILNIDTEVHLKIGSALYLVKGVNKFSKNGDVIIYTAEFNSQIPLREDRDYVVVSNGKVISKDYTPKAPENGFVCVLGPKDVSKFVKIGDSSDYGIIIPGFPYKVDMAIEGGPRIIEGGKLIPEVETEKVRYGQKIITAKTPRTVVAIAPQKIVFMVIDGYQSDSAGLTFEELAEFLIGKGYSDAMCLDGGSSSTMVVESKVVNNPSSGEPEIPVGLIIKRKND